MVLSLTRKARAISAVVKAAEGAKAQRDPRLGRERGMAGSEDEAEAIVGKLLGRDHGGGHVVRGGGGLQRLEQPALGGKRLPPPDPVDRPVLPHPDDPGDGIGGRAFPGPALDGGGKRFLHRILGEVEVAEDADERGNCPSRLLAEQAVDLFMRGTRQDALAT